MISLFHGDHFFLSNSYPTDIKYRSCIYKNAEHLYQAVKCSDKSDHEKIINAATSKSAIILGRRIEIKPYWDTIRAQVMLKVLRLKFRNKKLRRLLRETDDKQLIEQNYWHDTFWGVCGCTKHQRTGLNMIGQMLMKIRAENNKLDKEQNETFL